MQTGWLRFRTRAGEYYLGQARKGLGEAARTMVLLPGDMRKVEEATREQVQQLVQMLVGERVSVIVRLDPSAEVPPEDKEPRP